MVEEAVTGTEQCFPLLDSVTLVEETLHPLRADLRRELIGQQNCTGLYVVSTAFSKLNSNSGSINKKSLRQQKDVLSK